ncbi:MAG: lipopolysaccharide heptosyltransferase II [Tepidisphaeraceae bacterium]|jgi:lipopolysaccharide heptosyltransferase I
MSEVNGAPQRVLIIKPSAIGDIVHALPALARLRRLWPAAKLSWLVTPSCAALVQNHPMIDEVILFHRRRWAQGWYNPMALWELVRFIRDLRRRRFDLVIDFQGLFRSALAALASGAPRRIGFSNAREGAVFFYTDGVDCSWELDHAVERYLKIAAALGCTDGAVEFPLAIDEADRDYIRSLIPGEASFAVLLPGANWPTKRWPVQRMAALVEPLRSRFGLETVVVGSRSDAAMTRQIPATYDLTGKTNLRQLAALLERASLVIANDTGPMHIAAALGRPLVSPYGPTNPRRTGPFGRMDSVIRLDLPCSPCLSRRCSHQSCMQWLPTEAILRLAQQQIERDGQEASKARLSDSHPHW